MLEGTLLQRIVMANGLRATMLEINKDSNWQAAWLQKLPRCVITATAKCLFFHYLQFHIVTKS